METPHLYSAEPKPTVPSSTETVQSSISSLLGHPADEFVDVVDD